MEIFEEEHTTELHNICLRKLLADKVLGETFAIVELCSVELVKFFLAQLLQVQIRLRYC